MTRLLLGLLALLGLIAQAAPAEARITRAGATEIGASEVPGISRTVRARNAGVAHFPSVTPATDVNSPALSRIAAFGSFSPTVRIGIDRSAQ
ncbi:hypothetical protein ACFO0A_09810 [Novosphingobium tardum]|uniref:Uncharacterized protein n=1 Tax=Novosphingobium tardum TaxID=1538021 RepID=A0ABV8RQ00_9SPHN